jgi:ribokinase
MDLVARAARQPRAGETVLGSSYATSPGGKGANQAVAAARLGAQVSMLGKIGADPFGAELRAFLARNGVDVRGVTTAGAVSTGVAFIVVGDAGENAIVVIPGANGQLDAGDVGGAALAPGDVVVCQFETPLVTTEALFRRARAHGARTVLNCAPALPCPRELLDLGDVLVVNETELAVLLKIEPARIASPEAAVEASRNLLTRPSQVVVTTLGASGAVAIHGDRTLVLPGRRVQVVDTTGAGDTFVGALAARLAAGAPLDDALDHANLAAALSVQRAGAGPASPTYEELRQALEVEGTRR